MLSNEYNWDLEYLLNNKSLDELFDNWITYSKKQLVLFNDFYKTKNKFIEWLKFCQKIEILENRLFNYIGNKTNENISDQTFIQWEQKISLYANEFSQKMSGYNNIVLKNKQKIISYLRDDNIKEWKRCFDNIFLSEKHILTEEKNLLLSKLSIHASAVSDVFSTLSDNDIKFESVKDSKNKVYDLPTRASVFLLLKNNDRTLRKNVWISYNKAYKRFEQTMSKLLYYNYIKLNTYAKIHNFKDYIDKTCFNDEIKSDIITNLYSNVETFKKTFIKFDNIKCKLLKKRLKLKELEPWDKTMEISKNNIKYSIKDAIKIVLEVLNIFGKEYLSVVKKALNEQWISFLPKENKYSGAYSVSNTKGIEKKYILMNFNEDEDGLSTLFHELGHSVNSYYYDTYQKIYSDTTIFTAEIPSIVNELLFREYFIKKNINNKDFINNCVVNLIDDFFNTSTRQIIFSNFEYECINRINNNESLSCDNMKEIYLKMNKKYSILNKKIDKEPYNYVVSSIFRISHFYHGNFYVYKYAIGIIVAINVVNKIINNDKNFINKYIEFLKSGVSKPPLETIKILGIDLYDSNIYKNAIDYIENKLKLIDVPK